MTFHRTSTLAAIAAALTLASPWALATVTPQQEDTAQLKADQSALVHERTQEATDLKTLKADKAEGRMAAESKDAMRVYRDKQALKGEKKDIAADKVGSLQRRSDRAELKATQAKLKTDQQHMKSDEQEGRMAATSPDAEKLYQDQVAIKGQEKAIAADEAHLRSDGTVK